MVMQILFGAFAVACFANGFSGLVPGTRIAAGRKRPGQSH